jgi:GntR family transcriptional repressor for pyruvate dehydrogenase complex
LQSGGRGIAELKRDRAPTLEQRARGGARLSDAVAGQLMSQLRSGAYRPGDRLPPEREMAIRFGVSRTVIREAVGALASRGALVIRPGAGVFASEIDASVATESLAMLIDASGKMSYENVHEVREAIECRVASLAAQRATAEDIRAIELALTAAESAPTGDSFAVADAAFHLALADAAHNELFRVILEAISEIMVEVRRQSAYLPGTRPHVVTDHRTIAQAVVSRDAASAVQAMGRHLANSRDIVLELDAALRRLRTKTVVPSPDP